RRRGHGQVLDLGHAAAFVGHDTFGHDLARFLQHEHAPARKVAVDHVLLLVGQQQQRQIAFFVLCDLGDRHDLTRRSTEASSALRSAAPVRASAPRSSAEMRAMVWRAPSGPSSRMGGISARPTQTAVAPSASALSACTPSVIEPSTSTGYPGPTCARISGRTISAGTDVGTNPWWCETTMPPTPACLHSAASCGCSTPLTRNGRRVAAQYRAMSSQFLGP